MSAESTRNKGSAGEGLARSYLKKIGYRILEMNFRMKLGEVDIIARDKDTIVFIEVKSASATGFGDPVTWVPPRKQERIIIVASAYLSRHRLHNSPVRFDVVTVDPARRVNHVRDAFRPSTDFFM